MSPTPGKDDSGNDNSANDNSANDIDSQYKKYNELLSVDEAWKKLREELEAPDGSEDDVIGKALDLTAPNYENTKLRDLLQKGANGEQGGVFGLWILHKHHELKAGERMVSYLPDSKNDAITVTGPKIVDDSTQVVERWAPNYVGLEYLKVADVKSTDYNKPSSKFRQIFDDIITNKGVTVLGLCLQQSLGSDEVFIEKPGDNGTREQKTTRMSSDKAPEPQSDEKAYQTSWAFRDSESGGDSSVRESIRCIHKCVCSISDSKEGQTNASSVRRGYKSANQI